MQRKQMPINSGSKRTVTDREESIALCTRFPSVICMGRNTRKLCENEGAKRAFQNHILYCQLCLGNGCHMCVCVDVMPQLAHIPTLWMIALQRHI